MACGIVRHNDIVIIIRYKNTCCDNSRIHTEQSYTDSVLQVSYPTLTIPVSKVT